MAWQSWFQLTSIPADHYEKYGIYQVRLTGPEGTPIQIPRIGGTDLSGILSIGRSGFRNQKTNRSLGTRLWEYSRGRHSSAYTFGLAVDKLRLLPIFEGHLVWACIDELPDDQIQDAEVRAIRDYFDRYLELPPYNGAFPGR